ncbi:MAG TPA: NADH-quinone oxidoreductase subunit C [Dehalococcoidia bacterium]|nr:NADH-quinone oxidoreductase subunit C [Dehalococcoidia bacterium]
MTRALAGAEVASQVQAALLGAEVKGEGGILWVEARDLFPVARHLKEEAPLAMDCLANLTAVDYLDHFEVVYHFLSLQHNHSLVLKVRLEGREGLTVPSVTPLWKGADLQEREVYDLLGIAFSGHPNLKRILTWEGFPGHALRKDFV